MAVTWHDAFQQRGGDVGESRVRGLLEAFRGFCRFSAT